jgi:16S rRNA (uracil1498-N3)-methyltransferase
MNRWIPFFSERSVPRPDKKRLAVRMQRWQKIAQESFKQCGRSVLPQITAPLAFEDVLELGQACDAKYIFWENETQPIDRTFAINSNHTINDILIMLGPEGGFGMQEIQKAETYGFEVAGLGPRILRAETATIAACALMQYLYGDMGKKS